MRKNASKKTCELKFQSNFKTPPVDINGQHIMAEQTKIYCTCYLLSFECQQGKTELAFINNLAKTKSGAPQFFLITFIYMQVCLLYERNNKLTIFSSFLRLYIFLVLIKQMRQRENVLNQLLLSIVRDQSQCCIPIPLETTIKWSWKKISSSRIFVPRKRLIYLYKA